MSLAVPASGQKDTANNLIESQPFLVQILIAVVIGLIISYFANWAWVWPEEWVVPIKQWLSEFFAWLDKRATFGLFTVKELTRTFAWLLKQPLIWSEYLLWKSARVYQYMPVFWIAFATVAGILVAKWKDGRTGLYTALGILAIVSIDGFPYILQSLAKALKTEPWIEPTSLIGISELPGHFFSQVMGLREIKYIPWIAVVLGFGIFGHWVGGWRLSIIVILCMGYLAVTGLWRESMKTFSLVVVAVPFSALLGLMARYLGNPLGAGSTDHHADVRPDASNATPGLPGAGGCDVRGRSGASADRDDDLCDAADGTLHYPCHPDGAERCGRVRTHERMYAAATVVEGSIAGLGKDAAVRP